MQPPDRRNGQAMAEHDGPAHLYCISRDFGVGMRLEWFQVTNFRSVVDSGVVTVGDQTCLVGKNEAGKTAILHALAGLNPHPSTPIAFDKERDYPRRFFTDYDRRHPKEPAVVIRALWRLDEADLAEVSEWVGPNALPVTPAAEGRQAGTMVEVYRRYGDAACQWNVRLNLGKAIEHLLSVFGLDDQERAAVVADGNTEDLRKSLEALAEPTTAQAALLKHLAALPGKSLTNAVWSVLNARVPSFMYFSHYDRMAGELRLDNIQGTTDALTRTRNVAAYTNPYGHHVPAQNVNEPLPVGERVFVDFLEFAGTTVDEIRSSSTYESLNAKCEAASNTITDQLRDYWTQNPFLEIDVRVTKAEPQDPAPLNEGTIARARVRNTLHRVTVPFSERSAGFVWFFSFLVKFAQVRKEDGAIVLLLDEPGLTLHGKAQADLLRYFADRILPEHQLVFSTHSPFMVPADDLTQSRIVEDRIHQGARPGLWVTDGTKVRDDVLATDPDTLFPLQGALGYDVTQSLFLGRNTLLVEGPGDILFLKALSVQLKRRKREALHPAWTICPAGGIDKIQSFVSLFSGAKLDIAVMTDFAAADRKKLDQLKRTNILPEGRIMNYAEVLGLPEGDVEDLFDVEVYLGIVNDAFALKAAQKLTVAKLDKVAPPPGRLVKRVEAAFRLLPPEVAEFDHFTPADWLVRNPGILDAKDATVERTLDNAEAVIKAINRHLRT